MTAKKNAKKEPKLTDWFSGLVQPIIKGWYERDYGKPHADWHLDHWNGKEWWYGDGKKAYARALNQHRRWRGLAENPNQEA